MTATALGLTWPQLRDLRCTSLDDAADGWGRTSNRAGAARDHVEHRVLAGIAHTQEGEAAEAAVERLGVLGRDFAYIGAECGLVRTALNDMAGEMRGPQRTLRQALEEAESLRFTVHPDGSVSYPPADPLPAGRGADPFHDLPGGPVPGSRTGGSLVPPSPQGTPLRSANPHAARAQDIAERIAGALKAARAIDLRYSELVTRLAAGDGLAVTEAEWKDALQDLRRALPAHASPQERKKWWDGLTKELRHEYVTACPELVGNLDGIPAESRDQANRRNLAALIHTLEGRDDDTSRTRLAALRSIDEQLHAGGHPPMYLLGVGNEGNGRAIVSYGNPDTARNVSAYVPGLGTALDPEFAKNDLKRARDTAIGAQKFGGPTASIAWLGYDAPQGGGVAGTGAAEEGGAAYNRFMSGLVATNEHDDPHLTAIGHSYGSRTVGAATQHSGGIPGADDIILVGSPGVGVDHAQDLGVGRNHVFVGAAENDLVTKLPSKKQDWAATAAMGLLGPGAAPLAADLADPGDDDLWFGKDPASAEFGARRFAVADGPSVFSEGTVVPAHSNYFDPVRDADSADAIAHIVAGNANEIQSERRR